VSGQKSIVTRPTCTPFWPAIANTVLGRNRRFLTSLQSGKIVIWKLKGLYVDNQQALKLLHRYHDATNAGSLDELDHLFAEDFVNFAAGFEPVRSLAAMKTLIRQLLLAFQDWHVTVEDMFAQGNKVVTRWSLNATHLAPYRDIPATGLEIRAEGIHIDHIVDNKIAKRWACNNFTEVFNKPRTHAGK
jgi:steroid delta-isomerase-like uncharacterized protein